MVIRVADFRTKTEDGKIVCPNCHKAYEPVLKEDPNDNRMVQEIYPDAPAWQREQLLSGICSDECWSEFLGDERDEAP